MDLFNITASEIRKLAINDNRKLGLYVGRGFQSNPNAQRNLTIWANISQAFNALSLGILNSMTYENSKHDFIS